MVVTLAAVLAACGGGGGATDANAPSCPHPRVDSIPLAVRLPGRPPVGGPAICSLARYRAVLATASAPTTWGTATNMKKLAGSCAPSRPCGI